MQVTGLLWSVVTPSSRLVSRLHTCTSPFCRPQARVEPARVQQEIVSRHCSQLTLPARYLTILMTNRSFLVFCCYSCNAVRCSLPGRSRQPGAPDPGSAPVLHSEVLLPGEAGGCHGGAARGVQQVHHGLHQVVAARIQQQPQQILQYYIN